MKSLRATIQTMTLPALSQSLYRPLYLRLTAWYVFLSGVTSIALVLIGTALCYKSITHSVDQGLEELIASNLPGVEYKEKKLHFLFSADPVSSSAARQECTVQLYNTEGELVQEFGPPGMPQLDLDHDYFEARVGKHIIRAASDPIKVDGKVVGYIQVQVPVDKRDKAVSEFALTMLAIMPFLMIALGFSGYLFSRKASKPVEQAHALLKRFMADASHELRTPVHAIQLMAENVAADNENDPQIVKDMDGIKRSTERITRLVDDMLLLTKAEVQQLPARREAVRLDKVIASSADELSQAYKDKNIDLRIEKLEPVTLPGDQFALHRVFTNLLQNALNYTDSGSVTVKMNYQNNLVKIDITDTGIGIDAESLPHVFERFYRVDKSRARAAGGSGLGLSIVNAICHNHKGAITVASQVGKGTTFTVTLPAMRAPVAV